MQDDIFRASEIMDMAMQIERDGVQFYRQCAGADMEPQIKEVFAYLIDQEKKHLRVFAKMKEGVEDYRLPESYPGEMRSYVKSFVEGRVFSTTQGGHMPQINNTDEALNFAIEFEERSILFYSTMKHLVRASEKEVLDQVIGEEHKHIRRLLELRRDSKNKS